MVRQWESLRSVLQFVVCQFTQQLYIYVYSYLKVVQVGCYSLFDLSSLKLKRNMRYRVQTYFVSKEVHVISYHYTMVPATYMCREVYKTISFSQDTA